jgi:hypothetical protein
MLILSEDSKGKGEREEAASAGGTLMAERCPPPLTIEEPPEF